MKMLPQRSRSVLVLLQLTVFGVLQGSGAQWSYVGTKGQDRWPKDYPYCGGAQQSPIDITPELLKYDSTLPPIEVQNYALQPSDALTLGNNGHSLQISLPSKMHISNLPHRYNAAQLHLHWGSPTNLAGSEHLINSKQYPAELHIVHYNADKYPNISVAVDKSDGLAVLGVMLEIGSFNPAFNKFIKHISSINQTGQKIQIPGFDIRDLLPQNLTDYYRYDGSLTTPPCYPSVLWTVFKDPVTISKKQYKTLSSGLNTNKAVPMSNNFRKTLPIDDRLVLVSFPEDLSWMNTDLLVPMAVGSAVGLVLIVSLTCCVSKHVRCGDGQMKDKRHSVEHNVGEQDEFGSRV